VLWEAVLGQMNPEQGYDLPDMIKILPELGPVRISKMPCIVATSAYLG